MATNLNIDPALIDRALQVSGATTKRAAVTQALEEFIARRQQRQVLELFGTLDWDPDYDYKTERSRVGPVSAVADSRKGKGRSAKQNKPARSRK